MAENSWRILSALFACALTAGACTAEDTARPESADSEATATATGPILSSSDPANGAKLQSAPQRLVLNFAMPVRLVEVTVAGADGQTMPMMVSSAGANRRYELPLDGLETGSYTIRWRAIDEAGAQHQGTIAFRAG